MDVADCLRHLTARARSQIRVPGFQKRLGAAFAKLKVRILGACLLLMALILGLWAESLTRSMALREWERSRHPSERVWRSALVAHHWKTPKEGPKGDAKTGKLLRQASKSLPFDLQNPHLVWLSADHGWIAVSPAEGPSSEPILFCLECRSAPSVWEPLGAGWSGFDRVIEILDADEKRRVSSHPARSRAEPVDPREIRY